MLKPWFIPALLGSLFLTGCRFGNFSEDPKPREVYKSVELFFTQTKNLATAALLEGESRANENPHAPLTAIPSRIRNTFSDPLYFAVPLQPESAPIFVDLTQNYYLSTAMNAQGQIEDTYRSPVSILWDNPKCLTQIEITQRGHFDRSQTGTVTFPDLSTGKVEGRLRLTFSYLRVIDGDCEQDLTYLANCYRTGTQCSTSDLEAASSLYDLYIRQTGVLSLEQAHRVRGLAYEVDFE